MKYIKPIIALILLAIILTFFVNAWLGEQRADAELKIENVRLEIEESKGRQEKILEEKQVLEDSLRRLEEKFKNLNEEEG